MIVYQYKTYYSVGELNDELHFLYRNYKLPIKDEFLYLYNLLMKHHNVTNCQPHPSPSWLEQILLNASKHGKITYIKFKKGEQGLREYRGYALEDVKEFFEMYFENKTRFSIPNTTPVVTGYFEKEK